MRRVPKRLLLASRHKPVPLRGHRRRASNYEALWISTVQGTAGRVRNALISLEVSQRISTPVSFQIPEARISHLNGDKKSLRAQRQEKLLQWEMPSVLKLPEISAPDKPPLDERQRSDPRVQVVNA